MKEFKKKKKEKTKQKYIVPKIILRFIGYFVYVLASLIAMFCLLDNGFNDTTTKLDFFNYNIELTSGDYLTFVLILVVISIILIKQNKNKNINNEQSITKIDGTGSVSKKLKISGIFNLLIIILIVLSLFLLGVDGLWIILFIGLIGGYYVLMKLEKFIKKDIKKDDDKDIGGK